MRLMVSCVPLPHRVSYCRYYCSRYEVSAQRDAEFVCPAKLRSLSRCIRWRNHRGLHVRAHMFRSQKKRDRLNWRSPRAAEALTPRGESKAKAASPQPMRRESQPSQAKPTQPVGRASTPLSRHRRSLRIKSVTNSPRQRGLEQLFTRWRARSISFLLTDATRRTCGKYSLRGAAASGRASFDRSLAPPQPPVFPEALTWPRRGSWRWTRRREWQTRPSCCRTRPRRRSPDRARRSRSPS
jgi:hypothetical protein